MSHNFVPGVFGPGHQVSPDDVAPGQGQPRYSPFVVQRYNCAGPGCSHVKGEINHWLLLMQVDSGDCGFPPGFPVLLTMPWVSGVAHVVKARPCCGQECAAKLQSYFMSTGRLPQ